MPFQRALPRYPLQCAALAAALSALMLTACSHLTPPPEHQSPLVAELKIRARDLAASGHLRKALLTYQAVHALAPRETKVIGPIRELQAHLQEQAAIHLDQGRKHLSQGDVEQAREAFLKSLACAPDRNEALAALRSLTRKQGSLLVDYRPEKADARSIAQEVYNDPDRDSIVTYFLDPGLSSSRHELKLPRLDFELRKEPQELKTGENQSDPSSSGRLLYGSSTSASRPKGEKQIPGSGLSQAEIYRKAIQFKNNREYAAAVRLFASLPPDFKDVQSQVQTLRSTLKNKAEEHYKAGLTLFVADDLEKAIQEWEKALLLDPGHSQAQKSLDRARILLKSLQAY